MQPTRALNASIRYLAVPLIVLLAASVVTPAAGAETATGAVYPELASDEFMTRWLVVGPFPVFDGAPPEDDPDSQRKAFEKEFFRKHRLGSLKAGKDVRVDGVKYAWQLLEGGEDGVDFTSAFGDTSYVVAYAWAEVHVPGERKVLLGVGSDDGVRVWVNGELVHDNWIERPLVEDEDLLPITFRKGNNELLLKVQNAEDDWEFSCRVIGPTLFPDRLVSFSRRGNIDGLEVLLANGADVNATTGPGLTALHAARIYGRTDVEALLIENGADTDVPMPPHAALVDAIFDETEDREIPGVAVLVAQDGDIVYEKGHGYADLAHGVEITPETKFRIGSVTKQFTAAAILKLQEEGKLSVDDKLSTFVPDFPRGDEVTIHHLLTHTSGIRSYTSKPDFMETVTVETTPEDLIDSFKNDDYDFDPGTRWLYNNSGYFLLGYIIEKISGESYGDYLEKTFFEPLGMNDTGVHTWSEIIENEAIGYSYVDGRLQKAQNWDMSRAGAAGALYSTVRDLYRWNEAVFGGEVLSETSLEAAFTPVEVAGETDIAFGSEYGYGWAFGNLRGVETVAHSGGLNGFLSYLGRYPDEKMTIAVLTNCAPPQNYGPSSITNRIAQIYLWEKMEAEESYATDTTVDPKRYDEYVGRYEYPMSAVMIVTREGDRLFAQLTGQPKFEIFPRGEDVFFWKIVDAQITFTRDEKGEVTGGIHRQAGSELDVTKLPHEEPAEIDPAVYDRYVGEYQLTKNVIISITRDTNRIFIQLTGQPKFEIFPRSETEFFLKVVKADISFVTDGSGGATELLLDQAGRIQKAPRIE